jgi:hypothetical protein
VVRVKGVEDGATEKVNLRGRCMRGKEGGWGGGSEEGELAKSAHSQCL